MRRTARSLVSSFLSVFPSACLLGSVALPSTAAAQVRFATSVVSYHQGTGGGVFVPANVLGGPQGGGLAAGSLDVLSLGVGGDVTLAFDVVIVDGPGADLIVYENPFAAGGGTFAEGVLVEVSTNGVDFARLPLRYLGPAGPLGDFDVLPWGSYVNVPGGTPCLANVMTNTLDPFDPVESGGDAVDLAALRDHPDVLSGKVDLAQIHFVRLVDLVAGTVIDEAGTTVWDTGGPSGADVDAVAVIQHAGNQDPNGPTVDLWRDAQGHVHLWIADPDGLTDLDRTTLRASLNLVPVPFERLVGALRLTGAGPGGLHLVSPTPVGGGAGMAAVVAVSVRDLSGAFAGDQLSLAR